MFRTWKVLRIEDKRVRHVATRAPTRNPIHVICIQCGSQRIAYLPVLRLSHSGQSIAVYWLIKHIIVRSYLSLMAIRTSLGLYILFLFLLDLLDIYFHVANKTFLGSSSFSSFESCNQNKTIWILSRDSI